MTDKNQGFWVKAVGAWFIWSVVLGIATEAYCIVKVLGWLFDKLGI